MHVIGRFLEDFAVGQTFRSGRVRIDKERIRTFGAEFDPQLRIESEVLEVPPSRSRPEQGLIKVRTTTLNQNDEAVQVIIANLVVPRRPTQGGAEANMSEHVDPA